MSRAPLPRNGLRAGMAEGSETRTSTPEAIKTLLFLDLDDTVFQSQAKCRHHGMAEHTLEPAAFLESGEAHGFSTLAQRQFLRLMTQGAEIIPTTARNAASYQRVRLAIAPPPWVILNHGGVLLDGHGQPHPLWAERMAASLAPWLPALHALKDEINAWATCEAPSLYARIVGDLGQEFYLLVKDREKRHSSTLPKLREALLDAWFAAHGSQREGLFLHQNANNLTVMPTSLDKGHAVAFLLEDYRARHPELLVLGAGDSRSDAGFLRLCDYALIPRHAQLLLDLAGAP